MMGNGVQPGRWARPILWLDAIETKDPVKPAVEADERGHPAGLGDGDVETPGKGKGSAARP